MRSALLAITIALPWTATATEPLSSWNDGPPKRAILEFVDKVTTEGSADFVPAAERIAVFDNDGTLWCEQPMYFQVQFAFDRLRHLAGDHPEWRNREPYKSVIDGGIQQLSQLGEKGLLETVAVTHSGVTVDEFEQTVRAWMQTAHHPRFEQPYNRCVYQPMIEVLDYLRAHDFKTFIVSGGGSDFMRAWAPAAYGIPPEQIVGSCGKLKFEVQGEKPRLVKLPEVEFVDDGPGKPVGIQRFVGRQPIIAFGNSDGDFEMLQYTTLGTNSRRLALIVHHTDAKREYSYDHPSKIGQLKRGLEQAREHGWVVIDMKNDWNTVFAFQRESSGSIE